MEVKKNKNLWLGCVNVRKSLAFQLTQRLIERITTLLFVKRKQITPQNKAPANVFTLSL
jgi:hypothetical protein